jgi:hypothetical protein
VWLLCCSKVCGDARAPPHKGRQVAQVPLLCVQNRAFGPYLITSNRLLIWKERLHRTGKTSACPLFTFLPAHLVHS